MSADTWSEFCAVLAVILFCVWVTGCVAIGFFADVDSKHEIVEKK